MKLTLAFLTALLTLAMMSPKAMAAAEQVELPPEELAQETVLPVFERPIMVRNRNVRTAGRIDAHVFYGYAMTEPIADLSKIGFAAYYNTSEDNSFGLLFAKNSTGLSSYAKQLKTSNDLNFERVPKPESTLMLDYNWKAYYGKMSFSKDSVFNTSLYGMLSAGTVKYTHKSYPALSFGLGNKIYLNNHFALRADLRLYLNTAPIPFLENALKTNDPVPAPEQFKERFTTTTNLDFGLSYLF